MIARYRGELVRIVAWHKSGAKAKIATSRGLRWAQRHELEDARTEDEGLRTEGSAVAI